MLVIHPGGLGDVLLALPAMRALRATCPASDLVFMGSAAVGKLLQACSEIDRVIPLDSSAFSSLLAVDSVVRDWLREAIGRPEVAVCWMTDVDGRMTGSLRTLGVREIIVQSPFDVANHARHQSDRFLATVSDMVRPADFITPLRLPAEIVDEGRRTINVYGVSDKGIVALHPGSGSRHKCSEPSLFVQLARDLAAAGFQPIVVGGPPDEERVNVLKAQLGAFVPCVTGRELLPMAGVLSHARVFIGHDSGLTHLAAALYRPTISIFGPTCAERWAPRGRHVLIVRGEACHCDGWEAVQACRQKPCLRVPVGHLLDSCEALLGA